jgi:hypothetical protein
MFVIDPIYAKTSGGYAAVITHANPLLLTHQIKGKLFTKQNSWQDAHWDKSGTMHNGIPDYNLDMNDTQQPQLQDFFIDMNI